MSDTSFQVRRPVARTYLPKYVANAAKHVRAGGLAVIREPRGWYLLLPCDADGDMAELPAWALLDIGVERSSRVRDGAAKGLRRARIPREMREVVAGWCERDSVEPESTVLETLDCMACGACCRDNDVQLDRDDFARWRAAGRADLEAPEMLRARKKKLRVLPNGDCVHLRGNLCGIYALRPDNCRVFPAGSECCLFAREEQRERQREALTR
jgi:Fe-S-cluster containining protein